MSAPAKTAPPMAELELRTSDGKSERRELSRTQPLSIGRQSFNDVVISDSEVGPLHCRIGWNKTNYEVTAANKDGIDLNGKLVQHAVLKSGDLLRVGSVDLVFRDSSGLRAERDKAAARESSKSVRKEKRPAKDENELSLFEGPIIAESLGEVLAAPEVVDDSADEMSNLMLSRNLSSQGEAIPREGERARGAKEQAVLPELKQKVNAALAANRVRPGEQDIFKSPLVLGLGGGCLLLLLVSATIWFLTMNQQSLKLYNQAATELQEQKFTQAIQTFEQFLEKYPTHAMKQAAQIGMGQARVRKELSGATPNWKRGLEEFENFLSEHRDDPEFKSLQPAICEFAEQIAIGTVRTAEQIKDPDLLTVSADATRRLEQFSDPQNPPVVALEQIRLQTEKAKAAIRKQKTMDEAFVVIDQAMQDRQPITVLRERAKLLQSYPDVEKQKRVKEALQQAIQLEKSVVQVTDLDQAAQTQEEPIDPSRYVIPVDHARSRTEESASGRYVYSVSHDACFAVDIVTGEVAWRCLVGSHTPFFPLVISGAQPGLLLGETEPPRLTMRHAETGALLWRQPMPAPLIGAPLVHQGEIFVAAKDRRLYRLDLDSGRLKEEMVFSQEIVGPPTISPGGEHMLVAGETALLYSLSIRPLKVAAVTFSAHATSAVAVPLLAMGRLILMCENDRLESARLRVWDAEKPDDALTEVNSYRIEGLVLDRPVLRGAQLVVVSTGERLHAYTVSDDPEKKGLTSIGGYKVQEGYAGPMQLALGPDQQFWLASSAFRRFQVSNDSIRADQNTTAPGIASQPLQIVGDLFFVGRQSPYAQAVTFTQVDRERMTGSWRSVLGAQLLAWTESRNGGLVAVSEAGTVFSLTASRLQQGGIELRTSTPLEIPADVTEPLGAVRLADGRLALWCGGSQPKLWLINTLGQIEGEHKLDAALQAAPILLSKGLILPQPGKLKWFNPGRDAARVQDFLAPVENGEIVQWRALVGLDDQEFIACDANGRISRMQIRKDDVVHLAEAANLVLPQPVDLPPLLLAGDLWVADTAGTVRRLDGRSLDLKGERTFDTSIAALGTDGMHVSVQVLGGNLHALSDENELPDRWLSRLEGVELLGGPVPREGSLMWADRKGSVLLIDAVTGEVKGRTKLPQSLALGLISVSDTLYTSAVDGSVYRVEMPRGGQP